MSALKLQTAPSGYPVTIDEVRRHSRISEDAENPLIQVLIAAATERVEKITGRALITQTWIEYFDYFPTMFQLRKGDVQSITSIKYMDSDDVEQTILTTDYDTDIISNPARIIPTYGKSWPSGVKNTLNPIYVEYVAGYGESSNDIPNDIRLAMFMLIGHFYENREATTDLKLIETPMGVDALLVGYKVWWMRS